MNNLDHVEIKRIEKLLHSLRRKGQATQGSFEARSFEFELNTKLSLLKKGKLRTPEERLLRRVGWGREYDYDV